MNKKEKEEKKLDFPISYPVGPFSWVDNDGNELIEPVIGKPPLFDELDSISIVGDIIGHKNVLKMDDNASENKYLIDFSSMSKLQYLIFKIRYKLSKKFRKRIKEMVS